MNFKIQLFNNCINLLCCFVFLQQVYLIPCILFSAHTLFMSKAKYVEKVIKSLVRHPKCGTCSW